MMKWIIDKAALIFISLVASALAWAVLSYSGEWFFLGATILSVIVLITKNDSLKKKLRDKTK